MTDPRLQRKSLRAPLKSTALYVDGEHVFKARVLNLSEGGVLLSELPHIPEINTLPIAINLIQYPRFQGMSLDELKQFSIDDFSRIILKTKVKMMRTFENQNKSWYKDLKYSSDNLLSVMYSIENVYELKNRRTEENMKLRNEIAQLKKRII